MKEIRNTSKEKEKRNKGFPYKRKSLRDKELDRRSKLRKVKTDRQENKINKFVNFMFEEHPAITNLTIVASFKEKRKRNKKSLKVNGLSFKRKDFIKKEDKQSDSSKD